MKPPRWQCQGEPVLRDMAPDRVPVAIRLVDGEPPLVVDVEARIVEVFEQIARRERRSFPRLLRHALIEEYLREMGSE